MASTAERVFRRVTKTKSCWLWNASTVRGYGAIKIAGKMYYAHRVTLELMGKKIPDGGIVDHLCRIKNCVNPDHLEIVSQKTNVLRGESPFALNARKTHCINGHKFSKANTAFEPGRYGIKRRCKRCHRKLK